ncbi:Spo7-domain-containing protein [Aaosphaeria arxii CBS 175.79]|uniref:Spo7-domain-containing protein n=1 Tax=Aaosphaeria arxii CBS 175.79 TaxID=1450172 RepID=A0A6A5XM69_9PLEO|nr:Spo7-domain-containing protein [Aaosphaeria arxii CBS 175.79]KAF2014242.1 Spo7-domain-containing protein [Aaosphaeria arxii CBS 175.79]
MATSLDHIVKGTPAPNAEQVRQHIHEEESTSPSHTAYPSGQPDQPPAYSSTYPSQPTTHSTYATSQFATSHGLGNPPHDANDRLASIKTPRPAHLYNDPTSLLPSSPPQIYLNLLILEASLRSQYLTLRARRRQNTFFLTLLTVWILYFGYLQWLRPREDGKVGGSQYWLINAMQMLCLTTGVLTAILFYAIGQWERGVRWPRRWVGTANRGLRGMNVKIVIIRGSWMEEVMSWLAFMMPFSGGLWGGETAGSSYHYINLAQEKKNDLSSGLPRHRILEDGKEYAEEDIAPGGDFIHLLLLPKPFSPDFRENWELYRTEYWEKENERRSELRKRVRQRQREIARAEGGWLWWTGWRGWKRARGVKGRAGDVEKTGHHHAHHHHSRTHSLSATNSLKDRKRRASTIRGRDNNTTITSHSRNSSRSVTPSAADLEDRLRPASESRERRWSTSTTGSTATAASSSRPAPRAAPPLLTSNSSSSTASTLTQGSAHSARQPPNAARRPVTPNDAASQWQSKRASSLSTSESLSERDDAQIAAADGSEGARPAVRRRTSRDGGAGAGMA